MTTPTEQATRVLGVLDEFIANMTKARNDLQAVLEEIAPGPVDELEPEPMATADLLCVDGWVRPSGSQLWQQISAVDRCWCGELIGDLNAQDTEPHVSVVLRGSRPPISLHLRRYDTISFLTDEQFNADCDRERRAVA